MPLLYRLLPYLRPHRHGCIALIALLGLSSALELLKPWPLKIAIDNVIQQVPLDIMGFTPLDGPLHQQAFIIIIFMLLVSVAVSYVHLLTSYLTNHLGQNMVQDFRFDLFNHLQHQSIRFHQRYPLGDLTYRIMGDTYALQHILLNIFTSIIWNIVFLIGTLFVLLRLDAQLTAYAFAIIPLLIALILFFGKRIEHMSIEVHTSESYVCSLLEQIFHSLPLIQIFSQEKHEYSRFASATRTSFDKKLKSYHCQTAYGGFVAILTTVGTGLVLYTGIIRVAEKEISTGILLVFISYLASLYQPLNVLINSTTSLRSSLVQARRVFELLDADDSVREAENPEKLIVERGGIRYESVYFSYDGNSPTLQSIDLDIPSGSTVALIGRTGSGKTTMVSLLLRLYDPQQGRILIDGHDIRSVSLNSLRSNISMVLQDTYLFPFSVCDNISYGRKNVTREEVVEAAKAANAHYFITSLPDGYDTILGERGANLSGGQRQRLAIARAILKDAPILVLDEPTSALDAETEEQIMESLSRLIKGRTTVIITHRASLIKRADAVVTIEAGRLADITN